MDERQVTELFLSLTPEKVLDAVEAAGHRTNPICYPLNSFENRVYEVELEDRTRIVAKFYRPGRWVEAQILEEHQFIQDLTQEEIPVCPVLPFPDGTTLTRQDNLFYSLAERRGGRAPDELDMPTATRLGMLVGRMHVVAAQRPAPHRLNLTPELWIRENIRWLEAARIVPTGVWDRYRSASLRLADLADAAMEGVSTHRLHGDLHLGNLLFRDPTLNVLDFDDMVVGPAVQDLWLILPGRDAWAMRLREAFLEGYTQFKDFDRTTLRLIEPLRAMRMIHYSTWLARRWNDPIFPATWTHFGTESYWFDETDELERQLTVVQRELSGQGLAPAPEPEEEELSNKDLFWDWEG